MKNYTLHRIDALSLFKAGCLIGFVASCLPITFSAAIVLQVVRGISDWLGNMVYRLSLPIPLLGDLGIDINVIELLHLQDFSSRMQSWSALGAIEILLISVFLALVAAFFWGAIAAIFSLLFNLLSKIIGGIRVSMTEDADGE